MTKFPPRVKWTYKYGLTYASFEDGDDAETVYYISIEEHLAMTELELKHRDKIAFTVYFGVLILCHASYWLYLYYK